jgi:hypothetical protein
MPTTPIYAIPYPAATDPADVPLDMQELAERVEAVLAVTRLYDSTLAAGAASFDIQNIPQTYAALRLQCYLRTSEAAAISVITVRFNNDSVANYVVQQIRTVAGAVTGIELFNQTYAKLGNAPGASAPAGSFGAFTADIPHYAGTANHKAMISTWGTRSVAATSGLEIGQIASFWLSAAAVSRITVLPGAGQFAAGSRCTLYGLA